MPEKKHLEVVHKMETHIVMTMIVFAQNQRSPR